MAALMVLALLAAPQVDTTQGLSPRARAMLPLFPPPASRGVAIDARFSADSVWIGEQVELVTAAWFPRDLRDRLRRPPTLRAPALSGLWSAPDQDDPELADTRRVDGRVFDLFVSHQTLFPLGAGAIEAPSAVLTYAVPASSSFFAPEDRRTLSSRPVRLVVRAIPAALAARLGNGPTARNIDIRWQVPTTGVTAGVPVTVDLVLSGVGNVTLWPTPDIVWPGGVRIYPEPTEEAITRPDGIVRGVKRFRFTLVVDSAGVLTLPRVRYPHFDPQRVTVRIASAAARGLAVRPPGVAPPQLSVPPATIRREPWPATVVVHWWPLLLLLAAAPALRHLRWRRRRPPQPARIPTGHEAELRRLLGAPAEATPGHVEGALRRRGVSRTEAAMVREWLLEVERARWGRAGQEAAANPAVRAVLDRLRQGTVRVGAMLLLLVLWGSVPLAAQWDSAVTRLREGDGLGAESLLVQESRQHGSAPAVWLNLGEARWLIGDEVGAAAAWLRGARLAPRDHRLLDALASVPTLPSDLRRRLPTVPFSASELVLIALGGWLLGWALWRRRRTAAQLAFAVTALAGGTAFSRVLGNRRPEALVRHRSEMRVSPLPVAPSVGELPAWSTVVIEQQLGAWVLVAADGARRGWVPREQLAMLSGVD
jgi:hypothetical protein